MRWKVWISGQVYSKAWDQRMDSTAKIKINEIFFSIQGESTWAGHPTVFVRTSGCHLRCSYCDTTYAYHEGEMMSVAEILNAVERYPARYVCVTGGEPLLQSAVHELMTALCDRDYKVSLETSGDKNCASVDARVKKIIDVKTPDSGEPEAFDRANLQLADVNTEFKFVICSERDFEWTENFARQNKLFEKSNVLYSPSFNSVSPKWLAEKILAARSPARLQLQIHKYIWSGDARGI